MNTRGAECLCPVSMSRSVSSNPTLVEIILLHKSSLMLGQCFLLTLVVTDFLISFIRQSYVYRPVCNEGNGLQSYCFVVTQHNSSFALISRRILALVSKHYHSISFLVSSFHSSHVTHHGPRVSGACFTACVHNEECCIWTF